MVKINMFPPRPFKRLHLNGHGNSEGWEFG